jgi:rhodanese-related sulfurtransferase
VVVSTKSCGSEQNLLESASMSFQQITPTQLRAMRQAMQRGQAACVLVDVRTDAEVARGMIEGATHIVLPTLPGRVDALPFDQAVVFYCQSGARSAQACHWFAGQGGKQVYNLQGGILAWLREGYPLGNAN